ncbi:MAG TPA: phosphatase PAP2 family protein [Candidatus Saccharimonadales bacterium]|nr:phosphatase PAP2 family protein [Candidatus Saccharimonadales bacterium]
MDSITVFLADYLIFFVLLGAIYSLYKAKKKKQFILVLVFAVVLAWDLTAIFEALYYHPRPFVSQSIEPLVASGTDSGFPSQHTAIAMAITSVIFFYDRRIATFALALTFLVGAGRVWAHVHSWTDILGGLMVGILTGFAAYKLVRLLLKIVRKSAAV